MKIFITGATGYIGFNVAQALRRAGHQVWGLTRSAGKAARLAQQEIWPVIGDMQTPDSYTAVAAQSDVLIHAAVDYQNDTAKLDTRTIEVLLREAKAGATLIYTSGVWVYGDTHGQVVDETAVLHPAATVAWRPAVEQSVLNAANVNGIVIRPGVVYGKGGGLTGAWFEDALHGERVTVVGNGRHHWAMVHVDDLAAGYVAAAASGLRGEAFNLAGASLPVAQMVQAVVAAAPGKEIQYVPQDEAAPTMGAMAEALALDQRVSAQKAQNRLGWQPQQPTFIEGVAIYLAAWQAWHEEAAILVP